MKRILVESFNALYPAGSTLIQFGYFLLQSGLLYPGTLLLLSEQYLLLTDLPGLGSTIWQSQCELLTLNPGLCLSMKDIWLDYETFLF